ncbi:hypothetical protein CF326_g5293 [Tilletia indica]|nr:hypothetical protein CF326_g5293 [Tilletia indica]
MPPSPPPSFPHPPVGPTAGFTPSQAIVVHGSQSQVSEPVYIDDDDVFNTDNLIDYEPDAPAAGDPSVVPSNQDPSVVPSSQDPSNRSDSPTTSSHLGGPTHDVRMDDDDDFIDDAPVAPVQNSQATVDAASLSQEIEALSSIGSTPLPRKHPPEGAFAENGDDDPDYVDDDDNIIEEDDDLGGDDAGGHEQGGDAVPDPAPVGVSTPRQATPAPDFLPDGTIYTECYSSTPASDGHPTVDGLAARAASASYGIPVGCSRYQMPGWWKPTNEVHVRWAKRSFDAALKLRFASCPLPREFSIFVHVNDNEARQKAIDVYTAHSALQLRLMDATLILLGDDAHPQSTLAPPRCGLPISPRYVPARVVFNSPIQEVEAKAALHSTFERTPGIYVVQAWAVYEVNQGISEFNNELVVLLFIPPPPPGRRPSWAPLFTGMALPITKKQREGIPGFVGELEQEGDTLWFQFRPFWCWGCKGLSATFHLSARCVNTSVNCALCRRRGHTGLNCPRKTSVDAALAMGPAPPLAAPSAPLSFPSAPAVPGHVPAAPTPTAAAPATSSMPPPTLPPQSEFTFSYGRFAQSGTTASAHAPQAASASRQRDQSMAVDEGGPSAPSASSSTTVTPIRGSKRPPSVSSSSSAPAVASTSTHVASSPARRGKGKGKAPTKSPHPKTRSSARTTARPDGFVQTSLNFGPPLASSSSSTAARPPATPHSPKRSRLES